MFPIQTDSLDRFLSVRVAETTHPHAAQLSELESKLRAATLKIENLQYDLNNYLDPMERYRNGDQFFTPTGTTPDRKQGRYWPIISMEQDLRNLRSVSRLLLDTNYVAIGIRDRVIEFTVGDGFEWKVIEKGAKPSAVVTPGAKQNPAVTKCQKILDEWCQINSWNGGPWTADPTNPQDDAGLLQDRETDLVNRTVTDGEAFLRFFDGPNGLPTVRWVEPEHIRTPPGERDDGPWSFGIQTDEKDLETRLKYYVCSDPESDNFEGVEVPAWQIVSMKLNVPNIVKRGIPDFAPMTRDIEKVGKMLTAMAEVSSILASIAYLREHAQGVTSAQVSNMISGSADRLAPRYRVNSPSEFSKIPESFVDPGTIHDVGNGMKYVPPPMQAGAQAFIAVEQAILRAAGARWGMPEFFSGDASNNNYASIAVTGSPFDRATKRRQKLYAKFHKAVASKVLAFAGQTGRTTEDEVRAVDILIQPPSVATTDPEKETRRLEILARNKVISPQTWASKEGLDSEQELANWQAFDEAQPDAGGDMFGGFGGGDGGDEPPEGDDGSGDMFAPTGESVADTRISQHNTNPKDNRP